MDDKFFIPWREEFKKGKEYRSLSGKGQHLYKQDFFGLMHNQNVRWWNKPYFAIANEKSTVKFFLDAIKSVDDKEAQVYLSKQSKLELEKVRSLFKNIRTLKYANKLKDEKNPDFSTVTLSHGDSLIHLKMIYEPNRFGKWKVYKIEETDC